MDNSEIIKQKDAIIKQVSQYAPPLKPFLEMEKTLGEYSRTLYDYKVDPVHIERQKPIKEKIKNRFKTLFPIDYDQLNIALDDVYALNIADHHQVLNHPFLIPDNFISNVDKFFANEKQNAIVVISSGDVPPNNFFSRSGFQFHGKVAPLFSVSERENTSFYLPKRNFNFVERLRNIERWKEFTSEEQKFLEAEQQRFDSQDFSLCKDYSDQITVLVKNTWPLLFEEKMRLNLPELLYITQEELTAQCLIDLLEEDNFISACLFDKEFQKEVLDNFRGIVTTWDEKLPKGTHFFWRKYPERSHSLRMWVERDRLVPADERFRDLSIPLEKNSIITALKSKEIYPSLFMIFTVLDYYAGIRPLTGYGSVVYLNLFHKAWLKTLENSRFASEVSLVEPIHANGLIGGIPCFFKRIDNQLKTLYAADVIYEEGMEADYLKRICEIPFKDLFSIAACDLYWYISGKYVPPKERIDVQITMDQIAPIVLDYL